MFVADVPTSPTREGRSAVSLRLRVIMILAFVVTAVFVAGATFLWKEAAEDRHAFAHGLEAEAIATTAAFDREVTAAGLLLRGLSQ